MNINPVQNNNISMKGKGDISKFWKRLKQSTLDLSPTIYLKDKANLDTYKKVTDICTHPVHNKLIIGGTALLSQPLIDNCNTELDEKTRKISVYRTISKILAGTFVGIIVRGASYGFVKKLSDPNGSKTYNKRLIPEKYIQEFIKDSTLLKKHRNTVSTILALGVMSITNILLDAPLTIYLTNKLTKKTDNNDNVEKNTKETKEAINV